MSDIEFDTKTERYLHEHEGNLQKYYNRIAAGALPGVAFWHGICEPDRVRLRMGRFVGLVSNEEEFDGVDILSAIKFLEETKANYSEDHPIWNLR